MANFAAGCNASFAAVRPRDSPAEVVRELPGFFFPAIGMSWEMTTETVWPE